MPSPSGINFNGTTLTAINGNFTNLSINGNSFVDSVSALLPTIANSGDNRILTSDGTSTGINAESSFTHDISTGVTNISTSGINNRLQLFQNDSIVSEDRSIITFRRNRGPVGSETPLQSGDFIGSIEWQTLNSSNNNSRVAEILVYTPSGLADYNDAPTQIAFGTITKDGSFNYSYIRDDGTFNPTAGIVVNDNAKNSTSNNERATAAQIFNIVSLDNNEATEASLSLCLANASGSGYNTVLGSSSRAYMHIPSGISNSGVLYGINVTAQRNAFEQYEDDGSLQILLGANINYGHSVVGNNTTTSTNDAVGLSIYPYAGVGTIQNAYDIFLRNVVTNEIIDNSGTIKYGDGTITNRYGIYQESANPNYLAGSLTIASGLSSPTLIHSLGTVSGNVSISYDINKQIQTLTLDGTATNFIEGSGWPSTTSVDVLLEITVTNTTTVTWTIVDDQYNPFPTFTAGKYLVLLRSVGTTIQGHYIGAKTN